MLTPEELEKIFGVKFKKEGKVYRALCPFHPDRRPSFTYYPETNDCYCFGCHKYVNLNKGKKAKYKYRDEKFADKVKIAMAVLRFEADVYDMKYQQTLMPQFAVCYGIAEFEIKMLRELLRLILDNCRVPVKSLKAWFNQWISTKKEIKISPSVLVEHLKEIDDYNYIFMKFNTVPLSEKFFEVYEMWWDTLCAIRDCFVEEKTEEEIEKQAEEFFNKVEGVQWQYINNSFRMKYLFRKE